MRSDEVHLYFCYPDQVSDPGLLRRCKSLLSDDELVQMERFYFARHRHQYLLTRSLVRTVLSGYYPVAPADWRFTANGFGKPGISHPDISKPVCFNLSHADGLIVCGVTREDAIGVDVEDAQRSTRAAFERLSSYFSTGEIEDLLQLPPERRKQRFFDYWTLKEAYIKARGEGLSIPLSKFSFQFRQNTLSGFSIHPDLDDDASNWQFHRMRMAERYPVAVAIRSKNHEIAISAVKTVPLQSNEPVALAFL